MSITIQLRRGTSSQWSIANPILAGGEAGYAIDTGILKIGDGVTAWNDLIHNAGNVPDALIDNTLYGRKNGAWAAAAPANATLIDAAAASTLPATTDTALTALLQTVRNCLKWLVSAVGGKQDTLVSGTNIKTLNGASLLGSGNVTAEPAFSAGTTAQYRRGDKTWQTLDPAAVGAATAAQGAKADSAVQPAALDSKVDVVAGKGLSTEDYSTLEKNKLAGIAAGAEVNAVTSVVGKTGAVALAKGDVGLGNVDNTSDASKPISTATQTALNAKAADNAVIKLTGAQTAAGVKTFSSRSSHAGAYTPAAQPTHSATPTFDCAVSNVFEPAAMTGNVTSITLSNPVAGQTVQIRFQQDATGGRTCAVPSGAKIDGSINTGANRVTWLIMTYSYRGSRWEGNFLQVPA